MYKVLNPTVQITHLFIDSVNIKNIQAYNMIFSQKYNRLGPGATIKITRVGGVIPKIISVIKPYTESTDNCLPNKALFEYKNSTKADVVLNDPDKNETVELKVDYFFSSLGVQFLKSQTYY